VALFSFSTAATAVTYVQGFDVYTGDGAVNWTAAKNGGYQFAFVKATEGVNFIDASFATNMNGAHNAGVYVGPYHFARPDSKDGVKFTSYDGNPFPVGSAPYLDATSEAADFVQSIRPFYLAHGPPHHCPPKNICFQLAAVVFRYRKERNRRSPNCLHEHFGRKHVFHADRRGRASTVGSSLERNRHHITAND
jgi:hypothetical protein